MKGESGFQREGYLKESCRCFHLRDTVGQERDFHIHDFDKIVILLGGRVDYLVESMAYTLRPWDILLIKHHTLHKALIDRREPYERVILYLDGEYFQRTMPDAGLLDCFQQADRQGRYLIRPGGEDRAALDRGLEALEGAMEDGKFGARALREALVIQLLILINRAALKSVAGQAAPQGGYDARITEALALIDGGLSGELTVERLAERVYMSKYHFMRLFKAQTGSTVHAYVRQKRLLYAARLIRKGVPVGKAAVDSGFAEYSTFYRAFRDCFGVSPGQLK